MTDLRERIEKILEKVRAGAQNDGFHAQNLLAYPHQSDRYIKPAIQDIEALINQEVRDFGEKVRKSNFGTLNKDEIINQLLEDYK